MPNARAGGVDDADALRHHFLADTVTLDHRDPETSHLLLGDSDTPGRVQNDIVSITSDASPGFQGRSVLPKAGRRVIGRPSSRPTRCAINRE